MTQFSNIRLVTSAAAFAADAHSRQVRKELNEPYIIHPLRVGNLLASFQVPGTVIAAGYLHDVAEDTHITMEAMASLFPPETMTLVRVMTKWWRDGLSSAVVSVNKETYYKQICETPYGPIVKMCDRIDNLGDFTRMAQMASGTHNWARRYAEKTKREFKQVIAALVEQNYLVPSGNEAIELFENALRSLEIATQ